MGYGRPHYGKQLGLPVIYLVFFVEYIDTANRENSKRSMWINIVSGV
ncbi:MAG TPA: hypothetical protein VK469_06785 [Candidatus Kapabacteria bacterium]|nr:hypothetical protein [Candidatus Kapabacteria bacterium]